MSTSSNTGQVFGLAGAGEHGWAFLKERSGGEVVIFLIRSSSELVGGDSFSVTCSDPPAPAS